MAHSVRLWLETEFNSRLGRMFVIAVMHINNRQVRCCQCIEHLEVIRYKQGIVPIADMPSRDCHDVPSPLGQSHSSAYHRSLAVV